MVSLNSGGRGVSGELSISTNGPVACIFVGLSGQAFVTSLDGQRKDRGCLGIALLT